ncbi:methylated-DNA--[protein]-cysteine S-methyltransferase [Rhodobacteraceae bacterium]|nr:methylated-DNA--[protein]-cysteine S-methyltransferase [Paracoccaceae bacterium]
MPSYTTQSPLGPLTLTEKDGAITHLDWGGDATDETELLRNATEQLNQYFEGKRTEFTLPLAPKATPSQQRFLDALSVIPFGDTKTYGEMAKTLGISAQAAGQSCGNNPIAILIPCHRVTGTGNLGGFSAPDGIEKKVALLKLEGAASLLI